MQTISCTSAQSFCKTAGAPRTWMWSQSCPESKPRPTGRVAVRQALVTRVHNSSAATPSTAAERKELPVFPVISLRDYENRKDEIANELVRAASKMGFFYITGHDISQEEIDAAFSLSKKTFELPREVKESYPYVPDTNLGYRSPEDMELRTGNKFFECFGVSRWGVESYDVEGHTRAELWPEKFDLGLTVWAAESAFLSKGPEFQTISLNLSTKAHDVAVKVAKALFRGLGRDESELEEALDKENPENPSYLAYNHYPGLTDKEIAVLESGGELPPRLFAHSDGFALTVLFNTLGSTGLDVAPSDEVENADEITNNLGDAWNFMPKIKEWIPLDPKPGCVIVNVGDMLTRWTDGALHTNFHQARAPKLGENMGPRYAIAYFLSPHLSYPIQGPQKKFPAYTAREFLTMDGKGYTNAPNVDVWYKAKE